ncbi:hypothetical protein C8J57DRAFT_283770 [Mycena rebaudengoi]|nr:hypothetical protein C8J57DRAFT_283770 [Mycena rebaudengoi]
MVLISSKKYACETCIKGHRSSACKHTDRPLFEIKKKGRPVTQCEHCRELRKTKQVHVKCICELKEDSPVSAKKGSPKMPESAAFPNGLPEALEASQRSPEGASSDSDHGGTGCRCSTVGDGACHCCTPRKSAPRRRRPPPDDAAPQTQIPLVPNSTHSNSINSTLPNSTNTHPNGTHPRTPSHHILARIAELRPVLPRPCARDHALQHPPSSALRHGHPPHGHPDTHFSPYNRAYAHELHSAGDYPPYDLYAQDAHARRSQDSFHSHSTSPSFDGARVFDFDFDVVPQHAHGRAHSFDGVRPSFARPPAPHSASSRLASPTFNSAVYDPAHTTTSNASSSQLGSPRFNHSSPRFSSSPTFNSSSSPTFNDASSPTFKPPTSATATTTPNSAFAAPHTTGSCCASSAASTFPPGYAAFFRWPREGGFGAALDGEYPSPRGEGEYGGDGADFGVDGNADFPADASADFPVDSNADFGANDSADFPIDGSGADFSLDDAADFSLDDAPERKFAAQLAALERGLCGCGDGCSCPGCSAHARNRVREGRASSSGSSQHGATSSPPDAPSSSPHSPPGACTNPAACGGACLDCTITTMGLMGMPGFAVPTGGGGEEMYGVEVEAEYERERQGSEAYDGRREDQHEAYDGHYQQQQQQQSSSFETQSQAIDEWIREVSSLPPASPVPPGPGPSWGMVQMFDEAGRAVVCSRCGADGCRCAPGTCECGSSGDDAEAAAFPARRACTSASSTSNNNSTTSTFDAQIFGLAPAAEDVKPPIGGFLTVPGPGGLGRSRSSSTSSSGLSSAGLSALSLGTGSGSGSGAGAVHPAPSLQPPSTAPTSTRGVSPSPEVAGDCFALFPALPPPPPAYLDERMLFF